MEFRIRPTADGILAAVKTACATSYVLFTAPCTRARTCDSLPAARVSFSVDAGQMPEQSGEIIPAAFKDDPFIPAAPASRR